MAESKTADITTSSGFSCKLDLMRLDNMELFEEIAEFQKSSNVVALSRALAMVLGDEAKKVLYEHLRTEDGRVPIEDLGRELTEILKGVNAGKNS